MKVCSLAVVLTLLGLPSTTRADGPSSSAIDFNRHIRPILSEHCFACHGPDEKARKAKLRLDTRDGARGVLAPGKPDESDLLGRITDSDPTRVMPPPKKGKPLKPEQIDLVRRWIKDGANWSDHWAFQPLRRVAPPKVSAPGWPRTPIDHFLLARLDREGLQPSAEADKVTFIRRVTLDLTGLPPTPEEVAAFLKDARPHATEDLVDRLLQSPRYGEHRARYWLDAARYGDTHGLHLDNYREIWPYRDWVVRAFNDNKRYDRFLIEQLAGDLLPNPTNDQLVATGFNRCHVTTSEGGSIEEEVYVRNVVDRTETFATVTMGLTVGCARCHDHKYDPITMKEFYALFAFFNNGEGSALDGNAAKHEPTLRVAGPEQRSALEQLETRSAEILQRKSAAAATIAYDDSKDDEKASSAATARDHVWIDDGLPAGAKTLVDGKVNLAWNFVSKPAHPVRSGERSLLLNARGLRQVVIQGTDVPLTIGAGDKLFAYVYLSPKNPPKEIMLQWHSSGWLHRAYWGDNVIPWGRDNSSERRHVGPLPKLGEWVRLEVEASQVDLNPGAVVIGWAFTQHDGSVYWDRAGLLTKAPQEGQQFDTLSDWVAAQRTRDGAGLPAEISRIVKLDKSRRSPQEQKQLRDYFVAHGWTKTRTLLAAFDRELAGVEQERKKLEGAMPSTLIYRERKDVRPAYLLKRGEYDQRLEQVGRVTPSILPAMSEKLPRDRLGLAQWLVTPEHPLTARVAVNSLWQQFFGVGLVKTTEDFGAQGEPPSHPELLDWLALQFIDDGWDVKKTVRRIVLSSAYRQASKVTAERLAKDPANRLLSRGPRHRLDAEMLRDQALFVSGLLIEKRGGPGVKPPQPSGLWEAVGYTGSNTYRFLADVGHEKVHRRSLYTFWKRTSPPPQMNTFDAPSREACMVRRERTNTPLQALLLLNETQYVEAARALAERTLLQGGTTLEKRLSALFRWATARQPDAVEQATLLEAYRAHLAEYTKNVAAAKQLIAVGETKPDATLNPSELAAWTMIANVILNLDEVLTKG